MEMDSFLFLTLLHSCSDINQVHIRNIIRLWVFAVDKPKVVLYLVEEPLSNLIWALQLINQKWFSIWLKNHSAISFGLFPSSTAVNSKEKGQNLGCNNLIFHKLGN